MGSSGSKRRNSCQRTYITGAIAIGVPGWPELACCTASMHRVRMVLTLISSMVPVGMVIDRPSLVAGDRGVYADTIMLADDRAVTMCSTICLDRLVVRRDGCVFRLTV